MRWFVAITLVLLLGWILYLASPYWAIYRLAAAVERGDVAAVSARVNLKALRVSLAKQIAADLAAADRSGGISGSDAQLAAATVLALADPFLDEVLTADGILRLLRTSSSGEVGSGSPFSQGRGVSLEDLDDFLGASTWRGFRNVYINLPPDEPREERFRLQLRLGQLRWRLVSLELPSALRKRIAETLIRKHVR
ncbi:DUF2939 domain-containing protein [uncultured Enterovirga sp.]|uniref:DUF2939 domain-containing protein n=1 Tax=uncultured Enterovirga sp. TaxID=2026352 RepID=UPI0035C96C3B